MPISVTRYRILIASPGDLAVDRKLIEEVCHDWNRSFEELLGASIVPVMWEKDAAPEVGKSPQEVLNDQIVDKCDVLLGVFWTRMGTPTKEAESGTAEEVERFLEHGKPVMLYFSNAALPPSAIDSEQYKRLKDFKNKYKTLGLYFEYSTLTDFRQMLFGHLRLVVDKLHKSHNSNLPASVPAGRHSPPRFVAPTRLRRDQANQFRETRVIEIAEKHTPINLVDGARIIVHCVPLSSFEVDDHTNFTGQMGRGKLWPLYSSINHEETNYNGFVSYANRNGSAMAYAQIYRNGIIESVECNLVREIDDHGGIIPGRHFDYAVVQSVAKYIALQRDLGINPPIYIFVTLDEVYGFKMSVENAWRRGVEDRFIDRKTLSPPCVQIADDSDDIRIVMKPLFDRIWNAAKFERSESYDSSGNWLGRPG